MSERLQSSLINSSLFSEHPVEYVFDGARSVASGHFDGDGDVDLLGAAFHEGDVSWWENTSGDGISLIARSVANGTFDGVHGLAAATSTGRRSRRRRGRQHGDTNMSGRM